MQPFSKLLNNMLISVFHKIMRVEEDFLRKNHRVKLTIRETHMIEYIGDNGETGVTLSEIAEFLHVARPSVTVAARKLEEKGYLTRSACADDGRSVKMTLTREGKKVYRSHMSFHLAMVREIENELCEDEKELLVRVMKKLDSFFEKNMGAAI